MNVEAVSRVTNVKGSLKYDSIYKIIETKDHIFMFVNQINANILIKESIDKEQLKHLKKILKQTVKKYKVIK